MKLAAAEDTKTKQVSLEAPIPLVIIRAVFVIYLFFLLVVLPLAFHTGYNDIADTKWKVYMTFTVGLISDYGIMVLPGCAIILAALFIWLAVDTKRMGLKFAPPSATDICVIAYMLITLISALIAPVKDVVWEGYPGYYMGLYAQVSFCALYLFSSHIFLMPRDAVAIPAGKKKRNDFEKFMLTDLYHEVLPWIVIALMLIGSTPVMWAGIQNSLGRDMFHMAETSGIGVGTFASTIGNVGIYSEYVTVMIPAGLYLFCYGKKWLWKLLGGAWLVLAFLASFSARATAGFLGMIVVVTVFFVMAMRSFKQMSMWFASLAIFGLAARIAGTYQVDRGDGVLVGFGMERPAQILSQPRATTAFILAGLAGCVLCALIQYLLDKRKKTGDASKRRFRISMIPQIIATAVILIAVFSFFWYIKRNTDGTLPAWLPASADPMLIYSDTWGSYRLLIWRTVYNVFIESTEGVMRWRLFGIGPDNLYLLPGMTDLGSQVWGANSIVAYAHNEVINILVNMGFLGCAAYLGIFITAAITLIRNRRWRKTSDAEKEKLDATHDAPMRLIAIALMFGYFVEDFFGYQWVCITTAAFVIIGAGMGRYRVRNDLY